MTIIDKIKTFFTGSREKHNLSFTNDTTYDEKWSFRLSMVNLYTLLGLYTLLFTAALFLLIRYTGLKNIFFDLPPVASVQQINNNSTMIDSLSSEVRSRQLYLDDLQKILTDQPFEDSLYSGSTDSTYVNYQADFHKSVEDSILRHKVENEGKSAADFTYDFFFAPVKGTVSKSFDNDKNHFGVDVVTEKDTPIKSCLEGTVIFAGWTPTDGDVIILQHNNDFISVYKHCSSLLKKSGEKVQTADPLAIVGNTGKHSSGPHLHFEIWKKGIPLNPQEFISFKK